MQVHQLQQKQQLSVLREKAKLEVQASQQFLSDLLQPSSEVSDRFKSSVTAAAPSKMFLQYSLLFVCPHLVKRGFYLIKLAEQGNFEEVPRSLG